MRAHIPPWLGKLAVFSFQIAVVRFLRTSRASGFFWALLCSTTGIDSGFLVHIAHSFQDKEFCGGVWCMGCSPHFLWSS